MSIGNKTLTDLENDDWGSPNADSYPPLDSNLVKTIYQLRKKRLRDYTVEDLRIMIGQDVGLPFLLPMAIQILEQDPLAKGMHYKGDLLCNVLRINPDFYKTNPEYKSKVENLIKLTKNAITLLDRYDAKTTSEALNEAVTNFMVSAK
ncbi:MAG: hypothetical protein HY080_01255 [Gammaproteobacteria bacterium]|nr:hypothetical protein [Gammaproteobacteria bacterium]